MDATDEVRKKLTENDKTWYKEVVELRKKAGEYKVSWNIKRFNHELNNTKPCRAEDGEANLHLNVLQIFTINR